MYEPALILHSFLRLCVVVFGLWAFARALRGWLGDHPRSSSDRLPSLLLTIAVDTQVIVGLCLWLFLSPVVQQARNDFGGAMKVRELRYWSLEHGLLMLVAVALIHIGKVASRKAKSDRVAHRRMAIYYGIALLLIIGRGAWPWSSLPRQWLYLGS
jgi:hypothetical protein